MSARILNVTPEEYYADPCEVPSLSASVAKILVERTPAHAMYAHPRLRPAEAGPRPDDSTPAKSRGTLTHRLILGKGADVVIIDAANFTTKAAKAARDEALAAKKLPVLAGAYEDAVKSANAIRARIEARGFAFDGESEVAVEWTEHAEDGTPVVCRAMFDHLRRAICQCLDLKTIRSADVDTCERSTDDYGYDVQEAAYRSALRALWGCDDDNIEFVFLFAETEEPYVVTDAELDGMNRELGERKWRHAVNLWARCMKAGNWPAEYARERVRLAPKPWAMAQWDMPA